jgi:transcription elongation GreA/GreB family factor
MREKKISHLSPLGEALMGRKKGEAFGFKTPAGMQEYTIIEIA